MQKVLCAVVLIASSLGAFAEESQLPANWQPVAREIFAELIGIDTTHEHGATPAAQAIAKRLRAAGYPESDLFLGGPAPNKQNLVVRVHGRGTAPTVLYVVHLDVVAAKREDWSFDPFRLTEQDGYFYGRGTIDIKEEAAALTVMLLRFKQEGFQPARDIVVAFTDDEEGGGTANGVEWLVAQHLDLIKPEFAINPDAGGAELRSGRRSSLDLQTGEKVYLSLKLEAHDRGGHSSVPHDGNPIARLSKALTRIGAYRFPAKLNETTQGYFAALANEEHGQLAADLRVLGQGKLDPEAVERVSKAKDVYNAMLRTTCVPTEISGGHAENALPQMARATINCRILPNESSEEIQAKLLELAADPALKLSQLAPPILSPASVLTSKVVEPVTKVMNEMYPGTRLIPTLSTGASDSVYLRSIGIPVYGVTAMFEEIDDPRAHGRDERIRIIDYYDGVEFQYRVGKALAASR